jgi:hypothetical protein
MTNFKEMLDEFKILKAEIFEQGDFVVIEDPDSDKMKRYNQLLGFFYPQFRTTDWTSPLK